MKLMYNEECSSVLASRLIRRNICRYRLAYDQYYIYNYVWPTDFSIVVSIPNENDLRPWIRS